MNAHHIVSPSPHSHCSPFSPSGSGGHVVSPASHCALDAHHIVSPSSQTPLLLLSLPQAMEDMWHPPPLTVQWMPITLSDHHLTIISNLLSPLPSPPLPSPPIPSLPLLSPPQAVEDMWYPPPLTVRWMLITNSIDLKTAIRSRFPGKILETDFVPRHSQAFGNKGKEQEREEAEQGYREMVAEWLLLSSCNSFVLPVSGFSLTAAMYSLHLMPLYTPHYCDPEQPHSQTDL
ncbi:unnamed protein product [Closterium sp. NIES-53]